MIGSIFERRKVEDVLPHLTDEVAALREHGRTPPLYVQIPTVIGLVAASGLFCTAVTLLTTDRTHIALIGIGLGIASIVLSWLRLPWWLQPLVVVGAASCRLMIASADPGDYGDRGLIALDLAMLLTNRSWWVRVFSAISVPFLCATELPGADEAIGLTVLLAGTAVAVTRRWWFPGPMRSWISAVGTGLLLVALVMPLAADVEPWTVAYSGVVALLATGCAVALAYHTRLGPAATVAAALFPLALGAFTIAEPGTLAALTVAIVGFVSRSRRVWIAAIVALVLYGVHFYFDLDWGLVAKGGSMIGAGLVWLAAAALARQYRESDPEAVVRAVRTGTAWSSRLLVASGAMLAIGAVSAAVVQQEVALARSEVVYLELVPVDPRSLVQGDFMALGYAIEASLPNGDGSAMIRLDDRRVATWSRSDDGEPPRDDERRIHYFPTTRGTGVTSRAYLFQEGTADLYAQARYGMIAITPEGRAALVGLADGDLHRLGPEPARF